eukprot:2559041-Pleurochrysis_carterae.AAC.1
MTGCLPHRLAAHLNGSWSSAADSATSALKNEPKTKLSALPNADTSCARAHANRCNIIATAATASITCARVHACARISTKFARKFARRARQQSLGHCKPPPPAPPPTRLAQRI